MNVKMKVVFLLFIEGIKNFRKSRLQNIDFKKKNVSYKEDI